MPRPLGVGAKLFFPNLTFKLVRSNLPPHQAVFHCPPQVNKFDIKSMLTALYDIKINDVRTMNYLGRPGRKVGAKTKKGTPSYKKVIVTMEDDFVFPKPPAVEDGMIRIPPRLRPGKGSAKRMRDKINEQATERGISLDTKV